MNKHQKRYKLVVFGASRIGKTSTILQFIGGRFIETYQPSGDETYQKTIQIDNKRVEIDISDVCVSEESKGSTHYYIRTRDGFILMYSITSRYSFDLIQDIHNEIYRIRDKEMNEHIPCIIVGNKSELTEEREVGTEEGMKYSESVRCHFIESSAKRNENINEIFEIITKDVIKYKENNNQIESSNEEIKQKGCFIV
ncbi:hypothetical protein, conserved [Entamoeba dispar SAW760]|uniref:Uncharacterized protein n=1 Tax=Entamoeba dispar (strain ATCC PRA-260 / SAW760) TaxID=370354 RepID=B0E7S7_ENTDS|nr:uncharacterized protein EDI_338680 [Entamoeba dispar SAW760]EDR29399.1 hypothetical protein, conserved [Entamoeba dispar SAW760]|eukprot:EDR29399.1 hypothetical protein, conserved [Entamoeba dispar SAW760]